MFLIGFPLLLIPLVLYNIFVFIFGLTSWTTPFTTVRIISGGEWAISPGDVLIAFAILILFVEVVKATRLGTRGIVDHMLSMIVFIALLLEFLLVPSAATSTFFLLVVIAFVDVVAGFTVSVRTAQRDIGFEGTDRVIVP